MYKVLLLCCLSLGWVATHSTARRGKRDNSICQVTLLEQTFAILQSMDRRLQLMEDRLDETNTGMKCRRSTDGKRTCYKLVHTPLSWSDAREYCQNDGINVDLVSIETQQEHVFVINMSKELPHSCRHSHTSGRKNSNGQWVWQATGRSFNFTAWAPGQPQNEGEDACSPWLNDGEYWHDVPADTKYCFICEYH